MVKDERKRGWFWVENALIEREDLEPLEKLLYMTLARYADDDGECFPSQGTLLKVTGLKDKRTITKYINNLEYKKLLKIEKIKGKQNIYKLLNARLEPVTSGDTRPATFYDTIPVTFVAETSDTKRIYKETNKETKEGIYKKNNIYKNQNETYRTKEIENMWRETGLKEFEYPPVVEISGAIKVFNIAKIFCAIERLGRSRFWKNRLGIDKFFDPSYNYREIRSILNGERDDFEEEEWEPQEQVLETQEELERCMQESDDHFFEKAYERVKGTQEETEKQKLESDDHFFFD